MKEDGRRAIVIGTGFGGAITAHRLVNAGYDVCVFERGRRYQGNDFPSLPEANEVFPDFARWGWASSILPTTTAKGRSAAAQQPAPSHWSTSQGLWDVRDLGGLVSVHAAGFGGGSLIYANVHLRPPPEAFDEWPGGIGLKTLETYYDRVAAKLQVNPITESPEGGTLPKTKGLTSAAKTLNRASFYPPLAIDFAKCTRCGECDTGCRFGAKNTLDLNYLKDVDASANATVHTLTEVLWIERLATGKYVVTYFDHATSKEHFTEADYVFLCAGSICTTELLLRSKGRAGGGLEGVSDTLGKHFYANADSLALAFDTEEVLEPSRGPTITAAIPYQDEDHRWLMIQDGGYPAALERAASTFRARALLGRNSYPSRASRPFGDPFLERAPEKRVAPFRAAPDGLYWMIANGDLGGIVPPQLSDALSTLLDKTHGLGLEELERIVPKVTRGLQEEVVGEILERLACVVGSSDVSARYRILRSLLLRLASLVQNGLGANNDRLIRIAQKILTDRYPPTIENMARVAKWLVDWNDEPGRAAHRAVLLGMGRDDSPGTITLDKKTGELKIRLTLSPKAQTYSLQERLMRDIAGVWKSELRVNPMWAAARRPITVHHQGGCAMSINKKDGVVDEWGEVHGHKGLFVFDGAALPRAVGVNPSSTIGALAERNVEHFLTEHGTAEVIGPDERKQIEAWKDRAAANKWDLSPPQTAPSPPSSLRSDPIGIKFTEVMTGFHAPEPRADQVARNAAFNLASLASQKDDFFLIDKLRLSARPVNPPLALSIYDNAYQRGRPKNTIALTMHATIEDVAAFDADDEHRLAIEGTIDFQWHDEHEDISCNAVPLRGEAKLFVPYTFAPYTGEDHFMLYELSFKEPSTGDKWVVLGFKQMHVGEGTRAWADTTNLFCVAAKADGSKLTYGVARLSLETFLYEVLGKMEVTGADAKKDPARVSWAIGLFGDVFFGHMTDLYLPTIKRSLTHFITNPLSRRS